MTHAQLLSQCFDMPKAIDATLIDDISVSCAITGEPIASGYRAMDVAPSALGDFAGLFNGDPHGYVSIAAATVLANDWNLGSRVAIDGVGGWHPLIARDQSAKQDRPCWSDLVRDVWPRHAGAEIVAILTTDVKKRCWHNARVGHLGDHTPILIAAPEWHESRVRHVNWMRLIACLDVIERVYSRGFSKDTIAHSLLRDHKRCVANAPAVMQWEHDIDALRRTSEFLPALIIAQKAPTS